MPKNLQDTPRKRGIYLLPNLFTTGALFMGFYAVVSGMSGHFDTAAIAVYIAMLLDGLDGRVARLTNTQSDFGAQYDSLSDLIAFGVAPALITYSWSLSSIGKIGWLASFIYVAAGALRLARFNTQSETIDKNFFQGLPIPAGAAVITGMVWLGSNYGLYGINIGYWAACLTIVIALLMVSKVRYHSFKQIDFKGRVPFIALVALVLAMVLISINPAVVLFSGFTFYAFFGLSYTLYNWRKAQAKRKNKE